MSLKYQAKAEPNETPPLDTETVEETVETLKVPPPDPAPVEPVENKDLQHLKRTQNILDKPVFNPSTPMFAPKEPTPEDLLFQEKKRKAELVNSYAWTAVQIALAICIISLGISYLRAVNVAQLKVLK